MTAPGSNLPTERANQGPANEIGSANANDETDLDRSATAYEVTLGITSTSGPVAALQFRVEFLGATGGWEGAAGGVNCTPEIPGPGVLTYFNDTGRGTLRGGVVSIAGVETPTPIVTCVFKSREPVSASSFRIDVTDATDPDQTPIDPMPLVDVIDLRSAR